MPFVEWDNGAGENGHFPQETDCDPTQSRRKLLNFYYGRDLLTFLWCLMIVFKVIFYTEITLMYIVFYVVYILKLLFTEKRSQ